MLSLYDLLVSMLLACFPEIFIGPGVSVFQLVLCRAACGVCHSDLHVINKDQPYPIPVVLGHEITGEVVEHGKHTDSPTIKRFGSSALPQKFFEDLLPMFYFTSSIRVCRMLLTETRILHCWKFS